MSKEERHSFSSEVVQKLKVYVYRLIDPRDGDTFYVGKGTGNRVFAHIRAEATIEGDEVDNRLKRIREIRGAGLEVEHVIHRHGMDDATALEVEAALIDAYPSLTNIVGGIGCTDYGAMRAEDLIRRYSAEPAVFQHRALLISINKSAAKRSPYDATRYAWKVDKRRAERAEAILATMHGLIVAAYVAQHWLQATAANFPGLAEGDGAAGRFGFVGKEASEDVKRLYVNKRVPEEYRKKGAVNPVRYTW